MHTNRFTDAYLMKLKPHPSQRLEIAEKAPQVAVKGLQVWVYPSGSVRFVLRYRINGKRKTLTLGDYPAMNVDEARSRAKDCRAVLDRGLDPSCAEIRITHVTCENATVKDLYHRWRDNRKLLDYIRLLRVDTFVGMSLKEIEQLAVKRKLPLYPHLKTLRSRLSMLRGFEKHILDKIGDCQASKLRVADVSSIAQSINRKSPRVAHQVTTMLREIYTHAVESGLLENIPFTPSRTPGSRGEPRDRHLSEMEIVSFWHTLDASNASTAIKIALKLALLTAQRTGQIRDMEWTEIEGDVWRTPVHKQKRRNRTTRAKPHLTPLSPLAQDLLNQMREISGSGRWVFPNSRDPMRPMSEKAIAQAVRRIEWNIPHFTPHDLRRTVTTLLGEKHVDQRTLSRILGHTDNHLQATYDRSTLEQAKADVLFKWSEDVLRLVTNVASAARQPSHEIIRERL